MELFKSFGEELNYTDKLQLDAAFSVTHINYGKTPLFNNVEGKSIAKSSRALGFSSLKSIKNVFDVIHNFNGIESNYSKADQLDLWENYWKEYINSFDHMLNTLPNSITTLFIGRQAIEIGYKYISFKDTGRFKRTHDLGELSKDILQNNSTDYLQDITPFCEYYCNYIEGGNPEYLRYPSYKNNYFFAGNNLDIQWLTYNFSLILIKLLHYTGLDN